MALTPMMRQYMAMKDEFPDAILFFRLGDFYEMFFEDAKTASRELELTLTGKDCGLSERAPMCGVPHHSAEAYISRLVQRGYKVAICEQLTDPKASGKLVERGVVRVVTPGTLVEQSMLDERRNNFLMALCVEDGQAGIAYGDVSTGECLFYELADAEAALMGEIARIEPSEIIANDAAVLMTAGRSYGVPVTPYSAQAFAASGAQKRILRQFRAQSLDAFGLSGHRLATRAVGALLAYLEETQRNQMAQVCALRRYVKGQYMYLDPIARRNLELTETIRHGAGKGTLLRLLDRTVTPMGARLLRAWVEQPLASREMIEARLDAVDALKASAVLLDGVRHALSRVRDVERTCGRISYTSFHGRDCLALRQSFEAVPEVQALLANTGAQALREIHDTLDPMDDIVDTIDRMIDPDAPLTISQGGIIREGFSEELDALRRAGTDGRQWIAEMEARERETTGIKNLRISFHKIFGYCIEVTKSNYELVPLRYIRRQTLASSERYVTPELQEMEKQILGAAERANRLEQQLFAQLKEQLASAVRRMQQTAEGLKTLDVLAALAQTAQQQGYVRPGINDEGRLDIESGRHPVVEMMLGSEPFVPNDTTMNLGDHRMLIVTGPNMAGKSTYMRQVALITLMAHMGSFVPARAADICLTDRIFTRIGASDDLAGGQSTFLVEMSETAQILRNATKRSLILLDEIGRGTSTFDGLSIAWAVVEYICSSEIGAKTLFATHYHELSELEGRLPGVVNFRIAVREMGEDIIFLRRIERGGADKSFGIHVARLAGIPQPVVGRAQEILARLQTANVSQASIGESILKEDVSEHTAQVAFADMGTTELVEELRQLDVNSMTPMEALNALFTLREKARKV